MSLPISAVLPMQDEDVREVSQTEALLLRRLGLETLPAHETLTLRTEQLIVPEAAHMVRSSKRLVKSIQQVGLLHSPAVVMQGARDIHDPEITFEVIAGRRRVLAARLAGLAWIKCEVYTASTVPFSALLTLIENEQRSAAWVKEVESLRQLLDEHVGLTIDDLAALGFDRASLAERLKIAQLPAPLVERVLAGTLNHETARRLIRLTRTHQEQIAALAERGEEITVDTVKGALRAQIDRGLVPMQEQLTRTWNLSLPAPAVVAAPDNGNAPAFAEPAAASPLVQLVSDLRRFEQSSDYRSVPQAMRSLTTALLQQAQVCLCTAQSPHE